MSFYSDLAATADDLLREFGTTGSLTPAGTAAVYDPASGVASQAKRVQSKSVTCVLRDFPLHFINGQSILSGDKRVLMSAAGGTIPRPGDTLSIGGLVYAVVTVTPLAPALVAVMWVLQVRGSV